MNGDAIYACLIAGNLRCMPFLHQGELADLYVRSLKSCELAGVTEGEVGKLILSANPPREININAEIAMVPEVMKKLQCNADSAREYIMGFAINQVASAYMSSRLAQQLRVRDDLTSMRDTREKQEMLSSMFQEWSGLGTQQVKTVMKRFDSAFDDVMREHIPSMGRALSG